jgi:hypothetical protein
MPRFKITAHEAIVHYFVVEAEDEADAVGVAHDVWPNKVMIMSSTAEWCVNEVAPVEETST